MIDLTPFIKAVLTLLATIITAFVVPYIKTKTTIAQRQKIKTYIKAAVLAAEQVYQTDGMGRKKMEYARDYLLGLGYDISVTEIEAAVYEFINQPIIDAPIVFEPVDETVDTPAE